MRASEDQSVNVGSAVSAALREMFSFTARSRLRGDVCDAVYYTVYEAVDSAVLEAVAVVEEPISYQLYTEVRDAR